MEESLLEDIFELEKENMLDNIEALKKSFRTIRTGKVTTAVLDDIKVKYYGTPTALNQVATVLVSDATTIVISPWEKSILKDIEQAIQMANIGVNPNNDGEVIKLFYPPMTTEQRENGAKEAKAKGDKAKISIRNSRKNANKEIKNLEKNKEITEDDSRKAHEQVQKLTDEFVAMVDSLVKAKQEDLMKV